MIFTGHRDILIDLADNYEHMRKTNSLHMSTRNLLDSILI